MLYATAASCSAVDVVTVQVVFVTSKVVPALLYVACCEPWHGHAGSWLPHSSAAAMWHCKLRCGMCSVHDMCAREGAIGTTAGFCLQDQANQQCAWQSMQMCACSSLQTALSRMPFSAGLYQGTSWCLYMLVLRCVFFPMHLLDGDPASMLQWSRLVAMALPAAAVITCYIT